MLFPFTRLARSEGGGSARVDGILQIFQKQVSRGPKRGTDQEMVNDALQRPNAFVDQIFEMDLHNRWLIEPAEVRREAVGYVRKFDIEFGPPQNTNLESRVEIGQGLIVGVVDMVWLHLGDIENMRDGHIAWITEDEVGHKCRRTNAFYDLRTGKQVCRRNIARFQGIQPAEGLLGGALASAFAFVFGVEGMQATRERRGAVETKQDLVE